MAAQRGDSVLNKRLRKADLTAVADVREALRDLLSRRSWGGSDQADIAELLTSELVTNALIHTDRDAEVTATLVGGRGSGGRGTVAQAPSRVPSAYRLRVEVRDFVARRPVLRRPDGEGTGGRGLMLVQSLADAWGVRPLGAGKVVWFELGGGPA
ncbi:ATP-binding protein [Streptomyces sp. 7N604]|uniref:ATP-binding protein n=1 Tax=Streptomyces sp. 7N604 TaxID=3457415 RepID=UPI003FD03CFC